MTHDNIIILLIDRVEKELMMKCVSLFSFTTLTLILVCALVCLIQL